MQAALVGSGQAVWPWPEVEEHGSHSPCSRAMGAIGLNGPCPPAGRMLLLFQLCLPRASWGAICIPAPLLAAAQRPEASPPLAAGGGKRLALLPAAVSAEPLGHGVSLTPFLHSSGGNTSVGPGAGRAGSESLVFFSLFICWKQVSFTCQSSSLSLPSSPAPHLSHLNSFLLARVGDGFHGDLQSLSCHL